MRRRAFWRDSVYFCIWHWAASTEYSTAVVYWESTDMADLSVSVSVALVAAVVLGEIFSALWYADGMPWGRYTHHRYFVASIVADIGLALLVQYTMKRFYDVHKWEDAVMLAGCLALIYACLEAPHAVHDHRSFSRFLFHALHKFGLIFVMAMALVYFERF